MPLYQMRNTTRPNLELAQFAVWTCMRVINVEYYTNTLTLCEKNARRLSFFNKNIRENDVRKCERILIEHYQRELYSHFNFLRIKIFKKKCVSIFCIRGSTWRRDCKKTNNSTRPTHVLFLIYKLSSCIFYTHCHQCTYSLQRKNCIYFSNSFAWHLSRVTQR